LVTKLVASAAIAGAAAVGLSAPANADPSSFGVLSCSCQQPAPTGGASVANQINRGIETALTDLEGISIPQ
jgi:hypothetical protein